MPLTNEDLDSIIIRIDSDENYLYDVDLGMIIALGREYEFDVEKMCERYKSIFVKNLKKNNKSITVEQVALLMQRMHNFFAGVMEYYDKPKIIRIVDEVNETVCRSLLNDGADVNAENGVDNTPLHMLFHAALTKGASIDSILCLSDMSLSGGGGLSRKNKGNKTPIDTATNPLLETSFKQFSSQSKLGLDV